MYHIYGSTAPYVTEIINWNYNEVKVHLLVIILTSNKTNLNNILIFHEYDVLIL